MSAANYWEGMPNQDRLREVGLRFRDFVPGVNEDGTVPDEATASAVLDMALIEVALSDEFVYWMTLSNEVTGAYADWLEHTKAKFLRNGWPWTTSELQRRSRLWEVE